MEGRGKSYVVCRFSNSAEAEKIRNDKKFHKKYGVQGMDSGIYTSISRLIIYETARILGKE